MTGFYIILALIGGIGFAVGLTIYAIRRIDQGAPGWVAQDDEDRLGAGPCPKGEKGAEGDPGKPGKAA